MLTVYIEAAMQRAICKFLPEDGTYFCEIPDTPGVWADADTRETSLQELREVLEDWITIGLARQQTLPAIDGIDINPQHALPGAGTSE